MGSVRLDLCLFPAYKSHPLHLSVPTLLLLVPMALPGCPNRAAVAPVEVAVAHRDALLEGDEARAHAWLSEDARRRALPLPSREQVPPGEAVEIERRADWADGAVVLLRDQAGWRIRRGVLGLTRATTPSEVIGALSRAIQAGDYALVFRLLPAAERAHWTPARLRVALESPSVAAAWRQLAVELAAHTASPPVASAGQATEIELPSGAVVVLVREGDGWKVRDVRPVARFSPAR